ncbi:MULTISPECIES: ABC transporter permease [Priestia]|uniref:ABC transporter permease n=1 Tax=Priestia TaxID=2800373 RepID=UPI001ADA11CB|nr:MULTISPECIES: ABC transporter permease [Priestia]QTL52386.1 ABC transporter permease [Priestia aryabhattai]USL45485.1 ABC transporter permease [Priestia megaterium]
MIKLIKLELRRNNIRTYVIASIMIAIVMLGFLYLFAYAPKLEPNDKDLEIFLGYNNLIPLFGVLNMAAFCVLSAVMYSKFIIEDYSGNRPVLLFSYPISRKKILFSKLSVVSIFTIISMIISNLIIFLIFGITEKTMHLVSGGFTAAIMLQAIKITVVMAIIAACIGIIATGIGFIKKSVPTTIVSAVLLASLMCNIVVNTTSSITFMYIFSLIMIFVGIIFSVNLIHKVNHMEVE